MELPTLDTLSNAELLTLAAEGQEILSEGALVNPLVYRIMARRGLADNPHIVLSED